MNCFLDNCRLLLNLCRKGAIKPEEITTAGMRFIRLSQQEAFKEEVCAVRAEKELPVGSKLLPSRPITDEDGVLRCDGRLRYAECLSWETLYPIILPRSHWITKLIIKNSHEQNQDGGTNQVLAQLSARYWIISVREAIREWERECMQCRRRKAAPATQVMAPLPELRTGSPCAPSTRPLSTLVDLSSPSKEEGRPARKGTCACSPAWLPERYTLK